MLSFCHPGDSASLGSLCSGTVLVLKAPKCSDPARAPMQGGPHPYCAFWSCCNIRTDLEVFSVRFLQALREGNLKHSGETIRFNKVRPHDTHGFGTYSKGTPENMDTNPLAN